MSAKSGTQIAKKPIHTRRGRAGGRVKRVTTPDFRWAANSTANHAIRARPCTTIWALYGSEAALAGLPAVIVWEVEKR